MQYGRSFLLQLPEANRSREPCATKPEISPLIDLIDYVGTFRQIFGDFQRAKRTILGLRALSRPVATPLHEEKFV